MDVELFENLRFFVLFRFLKQNPGQETFRFIHRFVFLKSQQVTRSRVNATLVHHTNGLLRMLAT